MHIGLASGVQWCRCTPRATKKIFLVIFCWNDAKIGLNLVRCIPAEDIQRQLVAVYDVYDHDRVMTKKGHQIFG